MCLHVEQSRQAAARLSSHVRLPPSIIQTHSILIEPRTVAPACTSDTPAARTSRISTRAGTAMRALPSPDMHLLPYGRMITSTDSQPSSSNRPNLLPFATLLHWIVPLGQLGEKYLGPSVSSWIHPHGLATCLHVPYLVVVDVTLSSIQWHSVELRF
jgi:hypothetical protein